MSSLLYSGQRLVVKTCLLCKTTRLLKKKPGDKNCFLWLCVTEQAYVFCHRTQTLLMAQWFSCPSPAHSRSLFGQEGCGFIWPISRNPQRWRPHHPGALSQSCITLLRGSSSYLIMVNRINTYQRISCVRPKSVQPRMLWLAAVNRRCSGRSM